MNDRERFLSVLNFEKPDKFPFMEFMDYWMETRERWGNEGIGTNDYYKHFGLVQPQYIPIDFNFVPAFEKKILEETEYHITLIDETGCTKKIEKHSSAMPHYLDFPIKTREDFESLKFRLDPLDKRRYPADWSDRVKEYKGRTYPLGLSIRGPFAFCRDFMHFEHLMMAVCDDFEFVRDMMKFEVDFNIKLWGQVLRDVDVDFILMGEDMAYKNGSMFSLSMLNELVKPLYRKLSEFYKSNGVQIFILDSDGNIDELIPMYVESGITGILPLENAAGMDPVAVRAKYPKLQMIGGIDKMKIASGETGIDAEVKKAKRLVELGGYIPSFDHSVPPIVSCENYSTYINKLKKAIS